MIVLEKLSLKIGENHMYVCIDHKAIIGENYTVAGSNIQIAFYRQRVWKSSLQLTLYKGPIRLQKLVLSSEFMKIHINSPHIYILGNCCIWWLYAT